MPVRRGHSHTAEYSTYSRPGLNGRVRALSLLLLTFVLHVHLSDLEALASTTNVCCQLSRPDCRHRPQRLTRGRRQTERAETPQSRLGSTSSGRAGRAVFSAFEALRDARLWHRDGVYRNRRFA